MTDLLALLLFLACLLATLGLVRACRWLAPAPARPADGPDSPTETIP